MIRKKDGSLNLSIQAIVILVMAMAVLGLGLGFIRTLFDQGTDKLVGQIDDINILKATSDSPIVTTNTVKVRQGQNAQLQLSLYNEDKDESSFQLTGECLGTGATPTVNVNCPPNIDVPLASTRNYGCAVTATELAPAGLYTCPITVTQTPSGGSAETTHTASFFVEVTI